MRTISLESPVDWKMSFVWQDFQGTDSKWLRRSDRWWLISLWNKIYNRGRLTFVRQVGLLVHNRMLLESLVQQMHGRDWLRRRILWSSYFVLFAAQNAWITATMDCLRSLQGDSSRWKDCLCCLSPTGTAQDIFQQQLSSCRSSCRQWNPLPWTCFRQEIRHWLPGSVKAIHKETYCASLYQKVTVSKFLSIEPKGIFWAHSKWQ